jgi:hypothetical protein
MAQNEVQMPRDYGSWKSMITSQCGETLSTEYVEERLKILRNKKDPFTAKFTQAYGDAYTQQVIQWFERAKNDIM